MATHEKPSPKHQVFINFRGASSRGGFVNQLENALKKDGVNVYTDGLIGGGDLGTVCNKIDDSRIALVIFSSKYIETRGCLEELVKIKERMDEDKLMVIPIFYKLDTFSVKGLERGSGLDLLYTSMRDTEPEKLKIWKEALDSVSCMMGFRLYKNSDEFKLIANIVKEVKRQLTHIEMEEQMNESHDQLSEQQEDAFMDSSRSQRVDGESDVASVQGEAGLGWKSVSDGNFLGEATPDIQNIVENKRVDSGNEEKKHGKVSNSTMVIYKKPPPEYKVFINFLGTDLPESFVGQLVEALKRVNFNFYIDEDELVCADRSELLLKRIEESSIAIVIFSSSYTESKRCLDELVKIKEREDEKKLLVVPIFYKLKQLQVKQLEGNFGVRLWNLWRIHREHHIIKWKEALESFGGMRRGFHFKEHSLNSKLITSIVNYTNQKFENLLQERKNPSFFPSTVRGEKTELPTKNGENNETYLSKGFSSGINLRLEQLEQKLEFDYNETRIIGVVGMPGIGKTTLARMLYEKWNCNFVRCMPLLGIREKSKEHGLVWLRKTLLEVLLEGKFPVTTHESLKKRLLQTKVFVVLDDVSDKKQLEFLLGNRDWIKKGSKIVITTCDKSLVEWIAQDTYLVPLLNDKEAYQLLCHHAFDGQISGPTTTFLTPSRMFVDYARGHPLTLKLLGLELRGKDEAHWEHRLKTVTRSFNTKIQDVWRFATDQLNQRQKDVFLDIVYFFMSEDEYFVRSLLDSGEPDTTNSVSELRDLADKFLITISDGRIEMNDLLYRFGKELGSPQQDRLLNYKDIDKLLNSNTKANNVRGIFLDMSEVTESIRFKLMAFTNVHKLRYLKIYDSCSPQQCNANCKLDFSDGLNFPLKEVRYLHWEKFPLKELPSDFGTENLVDLRLPYSKLERVWEGVKETPRLKWIDLRHSSKLRDLSALSKAENLQRLNLEGCAVLDELPVEIENMKSLVFLNLRGCICLWSLPNMNLVSLKTLILSNCSNLKEFQLISESVEFLHLDGTSIKGLPLAIKNLQRLVVLNLRNCKMLESLPNCLGKLKALEELILSGCSRLKNLSDVRETMKHLQSLLIDRIGAKELPNISSITISEGTASTDIVLQPLGPSGWPRGVNGVSSLRRLSLSGNDFVSLQTDIWTLYNLNWLDVKECKMLRSIPMLPPRLQYFDAHGCDSLERVANPLALPVVTEQIHATFNFSRCNKLDQDAKDSIISYARWKSQLVLDALSRYHGDSISEALVGTCFPGWDVPAWFSHKASGSVLEVKIPPHWSDNRFTGIALCAVILCPDYHEQRKRLLVKCNCVFNSEDGSRIRFNCTVGSWGEPSNTPLRHELSHVFFGYTTMLDNNKHGVEDKEEGCIFTEASLEFQVTDGTEEVVSCKVLNCGFRLVYAFDERENTCLDVKTIVIPERIENVPGEAKSHEDSQSHDDIQSESYYDLTLGHDEHFSSEAKSEPKSLENKRVELLYAENDAGGEITVSSDHESTSSGNLENHTMPYFVGVELRLKQMEKVLYSTPGETCIVGVVGMPGIGKTTLAETLFKKRGCKFLSHLFLTISKECRLEQLRRMFLEELLKHVNQDIDDETTHESVKDDLLQTKVFAILDGVSDKKQLEFLLGNLDWIKKGSKIVVTMCDKSLLERFPHKTYVIPLLDNREALQLLTYHASYNQICSSATFPSLSRMFVDNAGGNPLALKLLGSVLCGNKEADWEQELQSARQSFNMKMRDVWLLSIDQLNERQKNVFLDIVYFFKSEDEYFVRSLLDLDNSEIKDLADKLLITISGGRVEMHAQLYTLSKDLDSPRWRRLGNYKDIIDYLTEERQQAADDVRGIFLDMSKVTENIVLESITFTKMRNLRYLKIYDSYFPRKSKADCKLHFPDGLKFPLEEVRYLHWVKFPLKELPPDFRAENLVDLRLPYSEIERVWEGVKDIPRLKWVDLRHSSKLLDLSALSKAENLQRLNLEGCTDLDELPSEIQNMKSLVFLNLRGCIRLWSLPKMNLISLQTLILSDCSNLKEFQLISESVEFLHLDGTSVKGLPLAIQNLQRLVVLNLKNCKMLECLPNCLGELKALEELILSGCSRLKNLSDVRDTMKHLQSLLIDGIGAIEMPNISSIAISDGQTSTDMVLQGPSGWPRGVNGVSSLRRLSLSGNDFVSLQTDIWKLYNLNWLDVKECKMLRSIPMLPPRLQYFDAHGCDSLERVASPLALPVVTGQIHATFKFSKCNKLDQDAKDSIISYARWKSQLVLDALSRYNGASILDAFTRTCFPGWEVPAGFSHQVSGSVLEAKLPLHWSDNKFIGIALCAVILFPDCHDQRNRLLVKCNCVFNNEDGSPFRFSCTVGGWSDPGKTPGKIVPTHVFIGHAGMLDIKKHNHTKASFEFQVTNGTEVLKAYEVLKCGFSLVYASDDLRVKTVKFGVRGDPVEANHNRADSKNDVAIYNVRRETEKMERRPAGGHEIVELPNKMRAHGTDHFFILCLCSQQPETRLNNLGREIHARLSGVRLTWQPRVFVSCHGKDLCITFVENLVSYLKNAGVNVFIDNDERMWSKTNQHDNRIEESKIAVVIFSKMYLASELCLNELVKMDELAKEGKLFVIPVFYQVSSKDSEDLKGDFGRRFEDMRKRYEDESENVLKWETSLMSIAKTVGIPSEVYGIDASLVEATVDEVQRELTRIAIGRVFFIALFEAFLFSFFVGHLFFTGSAFW